MGEENNTIDTTTMKMPAQGVKHSHLGAILGVLLILLVLVAVGLYLWGAQLLENKAAPTDDGRYIENNEPETPRAEADMQIFGTLSPSNELDAIEADVVSTNLDSLDTDMNAVELEMNGALGTP